MNFAKSLKKWWLSLAYEPSDPRYGRGEIKIVAIGGGTGISNLLRGLKKYSRDITAVVAVSDSGKSSGVIRKVFKTLPPGDIRKCLAALSDDYKLLTEVFEYRFPPESDFLSGHPFGNIWLAALIQKYGSFEKAVEVTHDLLNTSGNVYPSTLDQVQLGALFESGRKVYGEDKIPLVGRKIKKVFFDKNKVSAYKKAIQSVSQADLIVIGPGSLYTSIIPNVLVGGIKKAIIGNKKAVKIFVANCSTEKGETENMGVPEHIQAIEDHVGARIFDFVLVNSKVLKKSHKTNILGEINNITFDSDIWGEYQIIRKNLIDIDFPLYHDREQLAKEIILLYNMVKES